MSANLSEKPENATVVSLERSSEKRSIKWFRLEEGANKDEVVVQLQQSPDERFWEPKVLRECPLPLDRFRGRSVVVTGPGAVWMYAHVAAAAKAAGAISVTARILGGPDKAATDDTSRCESRIVTAGREGADGALLYIQIPSIPRLSLEAITSLLRPRLEEIKRLRPREFAIHGRAPCSVYADAAAAAVASGTKRVLCWSARDGLVVSYGEDLGERDKLKMPDWLREAVPNPTWPVVVGVIGDPRRGKSVFSRVLDAYRENTGQRGWILDCDGQSPTPYWYLALVQQGEADGAVEERKKINWTDEMERRIVDQIRRGKELFDVLIADLPGGNLKAHPPKRIPAGRERMMREVDAFVLLDREDEPTEDRWREELKRYDLDRRIAAVLTSSDPCGPPSLKLRRQNGIWRGEVTGLDRKKNILMLVQAMGDELGRLWEGVLQHARNRGPLPETEPEG